MITKLGDYFKITSGRTPSKSHPEYYNGTIPWIKTGDLKNKFVSTNVEKITQQGLENSSAKIYPKNTVLLAMYGATIGCCSILPYDACCNQACAIFYPNNKVNSEYLYYFLCSQKSNFIKLGVGGAQPNISVTILKQYKFHCPDINTQNQIITVLNKINNLINLRKQQLIKLDELVKARFIEMFGDPIINPMNWSKKQLLDMGTCKNGMNFHYNNNGITINCLGVSDFKNLSVITNTSQLPIISLNEMPSEEYMLHDDDIVFVRSNGNKDLVGRSLAIYPGETPTTFSSFCIRYRKNDECIMVPYLLHALKTESIRKRMKARGANIQNLNQQILGTLEIPLPPISLQQQFTTFTCQIDKLKLTLQQSLEKLKTMNQMLMQTYFNRS